MAAHRQAVATAAAGHMAPREAFFPADDVTAVWASTSDNWPDGQDGSAVARITSPVLFEEDEFSLMCRNRAYVRTLRTVCL